MARRRHVPNVVLTQPAVAHDWPTREELFATPGAIVRRVNRYLRTHAPRWFCFDCLSRETRLLRQRISAQLKPATTQPWAFTITCCEGCAREEVCVRYAD